MEPTPKIDKLNEENICMSNKLIVKDIDTRQKLFIAPGGGGRKESDFLVVL